MARRSAPFAVYAPAILAERLDAFRRARRWSRSTAALYLIERALQLEEDGARRLHRGAGQAHQDVQRDVAPEPASRNRTALRESWRTKRPGLRWRIIPSAPLRRKPAKPQPPATLPAFPPRTVPDKAEPMIAGKPEAKPEAAPPSVPASRAAQRRQFYGGPSLMNMIENAVEAITALGQFSPENASELDSYLRDLQEVPAALADALQRNAEHFSSDKPIDPKIAEMFYDAAATARGTNEALAEAHATHRQVHEREQERIENPRPGEDMWDVSKQ